MPGLEGKGMLLVEPILPGWEQSPKSTLVTIEAQNRGFVPKIETVALAPMTTSPRHRCEVSWATWPRNGAEPKVTEFRTEATARTKREAQALAAREAVLHLLETANLGGRTFRQLREARAALAAQQSRAPRSSTVVIGPEGAAVIPALLPPRSAPAAAVPAPLPPPSVPAAAQAAADAKRGAAALPATEPTALAEGCRPAKRACVGEGGQSHSRASAAG